MTRIKILFFAADPLSAPSYGTAPRLMLDEDIRRIREKVRAAEHRDSLDFDYHLAARTDDLRQALQEKHPQVVHFSGHGGREGLVFVSPDGQRPHRVDAEALTWAFQAYSGDIRVVVLNACYSLPQAQAIAGVVGCAIGTTHAISDAAAITFASSFYSAVAFGDSVQAAFDKARAALAMDHFDERETPQLVTRDGVDAAGLVLVRPEEKAPASPWLNLRRWGARQAAVAATVLVVSTGAVFEYVSRAAGVVGTQPPSQGLMSQPLPPLSPAAALAAGRDLYQARNYDAAFPLFERAAKDGNTEAMGFLGIAYLRAQGTERQPEAALHWLRKAGGKRDERAMLALAAAYEQGDGVAKQSYHWALYWYRPGRRSKLRTGARLVRPSRERRIGGRQGRCRADARAGACRPAQLARGDSLVPRGRDGWVGTRDGGNGAHPSGWCWRPSGLYPSDGVVSEGRRCPLRRGHE
jgi:TPR repeat protein